MAKRDEYLSSIRHQLSVLEVEARLNNKVNRQGVNISAEDILGGLLNLLRDWNLRNANADGQNFPAIDLADWDEGVVVQVSSDTSATKIRETLEKMKNPEFEGKEIDRLVMMFLKPKLKYTTVFEHDGFELEILDFDDLSSAVEHRSIAKLKEISAYLDEEVGKLTGAAPRKPTHLLPPVPAPSESFVSGSRDKELAELKEKLSPDAPVFLWGVGGIGKTEVAIQLARNFAPPEGAYFLHYYDMPGEEDALRETILRADFTDYSYNRADTEDRDQEFRERMDILGSEYPGAMLIIDNFDRTGRTIAELQAEPAYRKLTAMGIRLVFTTRSRVRNGCEIRPLEEEVLIRLMRDNLDGAAVSDDELRQLIEAVEDHTLMTVLMARTLAKSCGNLKPADILTALKDSRINSSSFRKVDNEHNPANPQARIYDHMKALFVLTGMNKIEKDVLRWATLLPEDGMDAGLFQACLGFDGAGDAPDQDLEEMADDFLAYFHVDISERADIAAQFRQLLDKVQERTDDLRDTMCFLMDRGWLARREANLVAIHPVIREVCREELGPTDENCKEFLDLLWEHYDLQLDFHAEAFEQMARCFSMASDKLPDLDGEFAYRAGRLWNLLGLAQTAMRYQLRMARRREQNLPADSVELGTAYNQLSYTYSELGEYQKALEYAQKALRIKEKALPADDPEIAGIYYNMGGIYSNLGDYQKSLQYRLKDLEICERVLQADDPDLAVSYNSVGVSYDNLGDHRKSLEYKIKGMAIMEAVYQEDHPELATGYNNIGLTYSSLGDYQKALDYVLKALEIRERILPKYHPDLAFSYGNIGHVYTELGKHQKALEYQLKALEIREKALPADHPDLALSLNNIGAAYFNLKMYPQALQYMEKALTIREKHLPADHPHLIATQRGVQELRYYQMLLEEGISPDEFIAMLQAQGTKTE